MAFKMTGPPYPKAYPMKKHKPGHEETRTELDEKLEQGDKKSKVWNPGKQARLERKSTRKRTKADEALAVSEASGKETGEFKGTGKAYRTERRAQKAEDKVRAEAVKRGSDTDTAAKDPKGVLSHKRKKNIGKTHKRKKLK